MHFFHKIILLLLIKFAIALNNISYNGSETTKNIRNSIQTTLNPIKIHSNTEEGFPPLEHSWECGTDDITKYISESTIEQNCPLLKSNFLFINL